MNARVTWAVSLVVASGVALSLIGAGTAGSSSPEGPALQDGPALRRRFRRQNLIR